MKLSREGLRIVYWPLDSESCLFVLEGASEGPVRACMVEIQHGAPDFQSLVAEGIRYEHPRTAGPKDHDQEIGTLSEILHKGRATCIEAAAVSCAVARLQGDADASVEIIPQLNAYGKPLPWRYHAVVRHGNGSVSDPSAELEGAPRVGAPYWEAAGHCCQSCAHDEPCESDCDDHDHDHSHAGGGHG